MRMKASRVVVVCDTMDLSGLPDGPVKEGLLGIPLNGEPISAHLLENGALLIKPYEFDCLDNTESAEEDGMKFSFRILPTDGSLPIIDEIEADYVDPDLDEEYIEAIADSVRDLIINGESKAAINLILTLL
jgi:hypothetical protein